MFKRAVTLFALIAMTFDHVAVGGGGGQGEEWGDKKSDMLLDMDGVETNLFDGEEDEMDQGLDSIQSSLRNPIFKCIELRPSGGGGGGVRLQGGLRTLREGAHRRVAEERGEEERHRSKGANQTLGITSLYK